MASVRPLRELLTDLVGDGAARDGGPAAYLAEHGHSDLPADLVAEAVVSFADTAPPEVAEQLAPFVTAHTGGEEPVDWFDLLTTATPDIDSDELDTDPSPWSDFGTDPGPGLDFGAGSLDAPDHDAPDLPDVTEDHSHTDWPDDVDDTPAPVAEDPDTPTHEVVLDDDDLDEDSDDD